MNQPREIFEDHSLYFLLKPSIRMIIEHFERIEKDFASTEDMGAKDSALLLDQLMEDISAGVDKVENLLMETSEFRGPKGARFRALRDNAIHYCADEGLINLDEFKQVNGGINYDLAIEALKKGDTPMKSFESREEKLKEHGLPVGSTNG